MSEGLCFEGVDGGDSVVERLLYSLEAMLYITGQIDRSYGHRDIRGYVINEMESARELQLEVEGKRTELNFGDYIVKTEVVINGNTEAEIVMNRLVERVKVYTEELDEVLEGDDLFRKLDAVRYLMVYGNELSGLIERYEEVYETLGGDVSE